MNLVWPSGFVVFFRPVLLGETLNGAYDAGKYPGPAAPAEFSARNVGNTWLGVCSFPFSMATTLPMLGETLPSTPAGFRPICVHVCASEWTSAQACIERTTANWFIIDPSFGIRPAGNATPFTVSGANADGVVPFTTFRSNVSVWLGAPARRMKITFFALFIIGTGVELITCAAGSFEASQRRRDAGSRDVKKTASREVGTLREGRHRMRMFPKLLCQISLVRSWRPLSS